MIGHFSDHAADERTFLGWVRAAIAGVRLPRGEVRPVPEDCRSLASCGRPSSGRARDDEHERKDASSALLLTGLAWPGMLWLGITMVLSLTATTFASAALIIPSMLP